MPIQYRLTSISKLWYKIRGTSRKKSRKGEISLFSKTAKLSESSLLNKLFTNF